MKILTAVLMLTCSSAYYAAGENRARDDVYSSTQTYSEESEEAGQVMVHDSEEDVLNFVEDYIKKDIKLKGSFLFEDRDARQLLKLKFSELKKTVAQETSAKIAVAEFRDSKDRVYEAHFYVTGANWGNLDINKIIVKRVYTIKNQGKKPEQTKPGQK